MRVQHLMGALLAQHKTLQGDFKQLSVMCTAKDQRIAHLERALQRILDDRPPRGLRGALLQGSPSDRAAGTVSVPVGRGVVWQRHPPAEVSALHEVSRTFR